MKKCILNLSVLGASVLTVLLASSVVFADEPSKKEVDREPATSVPANPMYFRPPYAPMPYAQPPMMNYGVGGYAQFQAQGMYAPLWPRPDDLGMMTGQAAMAGCPYVGIPMRQPNGCTPFPGGGMFLGLGMGVGGFMESWDNKSVGEDLSYSSQYDRNRKNRRRGGTYARDRERRRNSRGTKGDDSVTRIEFPTTPSSEEEPKEEVAEEPTDDGVDCVKSPCPPRNPPKKQPVVSRPDKTEAQAPCDGDCDKGSNKEVATDKTPAGTKDDTCDNNDFGETHSTIALVLNDENITKKEFDRELNRNVTKCIKASHSLDNKSIFYGKCVGNNPVVGGKKPCVNQAYTVKTSISYRAALRCANAINPSQRMSEKEYIPTLNHESRFHYNAYNDMNSPSIGIAQLATAVRVVGQNESGEDIKEYKNALGDVVTKLQKLDGKEVPPQCARFAKYFTKAELDAPKSNKCDLIDKEKNPDKSMAYGAISFSLFKSQMSYYIKNGKNNCKIHDEYKKVILSRYMSNIAMLAYNKGSGPAFKIICNALKKPPKNAAEAKDTIATQLSIQGAKKLGLTIGGIDYGSKLNNDLLTIQKAANSMCHGFGG